MFHTPSAICITLDLVGYACMYVNACVKTTWPHIYIAYRKKGMPVNVALNVLKANREAVENPSIYIVYTIH